MTVLLYDLVGADETRPFSPHCWKASMALAHKGLEFRTIPTRFLDVPHVEGGVSKTVPVIRDGDRVVADSFDIALYLEDAYPDRPTLFGGEGGKATARFVERWSQTQLHPFLGSAALVEIFRAQDADNRVYFRRSRATAGRWRRPRPSATRICRPSASGWSRCAACWNISPSSADSRRCSATTSSSAPSSGSG